MLTLNHKTKTVQANGNQYHLTPKEWGILELLVQHPNQSFTAEEIYERVWKATPFACEGIVAVHLRHIREKIEVDPSTPTLIQSMWGHGYRYVITN